MNIGTHVFFQLRFSQGICPVSVDFPGGSEGKASASMQETWVQSLGGEDTLEEGLATHSSILAWKTPQMEKPGGL